MFHPALWKLIRLQWRGSFRQIGRSLKTVRGIFFFCFIVAMSLYGLGSLYFASVLSSRSAQFSGAIDKIQDDFLPLGLLFFTSYVILFSTGEATVYFTAAEAAFLFPAPITRKQLLSYTLLKSLLGMAGVSAFFAMFTGAAIQMAVARWLAVLLTLIFLQLLTMNVAFLRQVMEEKVHVQVRRILGIIIGAAVLVALVQTSNAAVGQDFIALWRAFQESTVASWLLAPFQIFVRALRARDWMTFITYASILLIIDLLLLSLAYRLDALSLEAALAISEKMTARIKLFQSKGAMHAFGPANSSVAERRIPQFPFWSGVGPVLWQRLTTTFRSSTKLLWVAAAAIAVAGGLVYLFSRVDKGNSVPGPIAGVGAMAYMSFLLSLMLQNDIERIGYLKSLPIRSLSIVVGDWIGFPILLSMLQSMFIASLACFFPHIATWLVAGALLTLPLNLLLFGVDKLVFYVYPTRMAKGAPGDFQKAGKQMVFMAMKMLMLGAAALIVVLASLPGALLLQSPLVAVASAAFILALECGAMIPMLVVAFDRFDPSIATEG
jgi:ABC-2 type transport system permease protein